jgi:7-carboxy-7-deazaguanine synthase
MIYQIAEKFKSIQGEGLYAGTPMAFIRFVGCSVGKKVCHACDTDFERTMPWRGGGEFEPEQLYLWAMDHQHVCLTGGEPLDQDLIPLIETVPGTFHIETSGTVKPEWLPKREYNFSAYRHFGKAYRAVYLTVSPKPGFRADMIEMADEIKVLVPGLGSGEGWPTLEQAESWVREDRPVYLQPRNSKYDVDQNNLHLVQDILRDHPSLRLSVQMHKILKVQ